MKYLKIANILLLILVVVNPILIFIHESSGEFSFARVYWPNVILFSFPFVALYFLLFWSVLTDRLGSRVLEMLLLVGNAFFGILSLLATISLWNRSDTQLAWLGPYVGSLIAVCITIIIGFIQFIMLLKNRSEKSA